MRGPYHQLHVHLVWATWDRRPMLEPGSAEIVIRSIRAKYTELGCVVIAIGLMPDHVHMLVRLRPSVPVSELVRQVNGISSYQVNTSGNGQRLRWQGGYGAFAVCRDHVEAVCSYVDNQAERHAGDSLTTDLEISEADAGEDASASG